MGAGVCSGRTSDGTAAEWEPAYVAESDPLQSLLDSLREVAGLEFWTYAFRRELYCAPVHPGDALDTSALLEVSPVKSTWLGRGVFVNTRARYRRSSDHVMVAESKNALFVYGCSQSCGAMPARRPDRRPRLADAESMSYRRAIDRATACESLTPDRIRLGDALPVLTFNPDFMDLIRAAQGTRHPVPMHTDRA